MSLEEIIAIFQRINNLGYVRSRRSGPTGIGYTLEQLLELEESNLQLPDYDLIEIKSKRRNTNNLITLFTFNRGAWLLPQKEIIQTIGYIDERGRHALYATVNNVMNNQGLLINASKDAIELLHNHERTIARWTFVDIIKRFKAKMPALLLVQADVRINNEGIEEFHYNEALLNLTLNQS